uniref:Uncharacterized protein n=1 Tax=Lepeophtheirus salmonis TaxID=72036 RepID=A0A0K2UP05_LEPSM
MQFEKLKKCLCRYETKFIKTLMFWNGMKIHINNITNSTDKHWISVSLEKVKVSKVLEIVKCIKPELTMKTIYML